MAQQPLKARQSLAERRAAFAEGQKDAIAQEEKSIARLADFAKLTPAEKQAKTVAEAREARSAFDADQAKAVKAQRKAAAGPAENKAIVPADENKSLDSVDFASASAKEAAEAAGLSADSFKRRKKSSDRGFTKADVERVIGSTED